MIEENKMEIGISKTRMTKLLVFSVLFLAAGLWMIFTNPQTGNGLFNNPVVKAIAGYGATIMGAFGIYFFTGKIFSQTPGLIIDQEGICDNSSMLKLGKVPWKDITHIYEQTIQAPMASKQYFITVGLTDPAKFIARGTNAVKRKLLATNAKSYGSPLQISTNGLKISHKDLLKLLNEALTKYKEKTSQ